MKDIQLVISRSETGAGTRGSSLGPDAIRISSYEAGLPLFENSRLAEIQTPPLREHHFKQSSINHLDEFVSLYQSLSSAIVNMLRYPDKNLILSGDHSNAAGFISGIKEVYPRERTGLIWIDAHSDLHSPYTSPSGNVHGMPVALLLGLDNQKQLVRHPGEHIKATWDMLKKNGDLNIQPKILPEDMVFIDIRDLEKQEWKIIKEKNLKYFTPEDREKKGASAIAKETLQYLDHCRYLYISFDVDSMDASLVPGTGTPVDNGLSKKDAITLLENFWHQDKCRALEITEVNPLLDYKNQTAKTVVEILRKVTVF